MGLCRAHTSNALAGVQCWWHGARQVLGYAQKPAPFPWRHRKGSGNNGWNEELMATQDIGEGSQGQLRKPTRRWHSKIDLDEGGCRQPEGLDEELVAFPGDTALEEGEYGEAITLPPLRKPPHGGLHLCGGFAARLEEPHHTKIATILLHSSGFFMSATDCTVDADFLKIRIHALHEASESVRVAWLTRPSSAWLFDTQHGGEGKGMPAR